MKPASLLRGRTGLVRRLASPSMGRSRRGTPSSLSRCQLPASTSASDVPRGIASAPPQHQAARLLSTTAPTHAQTTLEERRRTILAHALHRVHDEGWTDDAVASATLDAGLPPAYIGRASAAASSFGSAALVAFFMDECNANLRKELLELRKKGGEAAVNDTVEHVSSRIHHALRARLAMVLPFVASNRWHEGMAIGALPQNAYRTAHQLDNMASIVLEYALGKDNGSNPAQRAAVVAAYAAAELHLLADGTEGTVSGSSLSLSGERYQSTWAFLEDRSKEVARLIVDGASLNGVPLPNPTHVMAASAVATSLAGAALSLAAPSAAAVAGSILPRAMESMMTPLQSMVGSQLTTPGRDGTRPSDYAMNTDALPPFDASEEIFSGSSTGKAS